MEAFRGAADTIRVVGHRGARGVLPENSLEGFGFVLSTGVELLEFDVVLTKDGVPVITHNHRLHSASFRDKDGHFLRGEEPKVSSLRLEDLTRFDIGRLDGQSIYGQRFPDQAQMDGVRVPSLDDLLHLVSQPKNQRAHLLLELKSDPDMARDADYRRGLVAAVVGRVRAAGVERRTLLHSFDWELLAECQRQAPDMPASYLSQMPDNEADAGEDSALEVTPLFEKGVQSIPGKVKEAGGQLWCPYYADITPESLAAARAADLVVVVWTVNEMPDIDRMIDLRVDAICTDYPGRVQRRLADRGYRWLDQQDPAEAAPISPHQPVLA